mmetsp:Transcript_24992/g.54805  ORF Transcript_24992/g.54805 Transcript_24992/m.54805 type:complete len:395 (+) Transcript_24992:282-1466(+)|eukprot:CAMPEP_0168191530 /NCGR_PEP_ID=MMETSP0139_2-20121125/17567_1 /TAXON_ID=44445 /ORGANISM="Pseudo-nitzschia australis, Strain 10249 10 AB" /LENGTH=394 /DNA_ID=CAMNT_0008114715 /DNA_START=183 /DNA_END=1367 /DNA_ORIENTATION=+
MITTRKLGGFVIPQRTMTQTFFSAFNGMVSLLSEKNRVGFVDALEKGIVQEEVLSQASAGPMMMLSLFHELQNPLFKKNQFDANQFLEGVVPALENFHNVSAALENELHEVSRKSQQESSSKTDTEEETSNDIDDETPPTALGAVTKEEKESVLKALHIMKGSDDNDSRSKKQLLDAEAILNHEWMDEARDYPESLAGQLSRMVSKDLFQINQLSSKTAFLLQNQSRNILFREGSCRVHNVALLSARACLFKEKEVPASDSNDEIDNNNSRAKEYEAIDYEFGDDHDHAESGTAVAAQLEVLYDVTQDFVVGKSTVDDSKEIKEEKSSDDTSTSSETKNEASNESENEEYTQTTIVSVATLEGWLHEGPDGGELRWKLASYRPPYEFPGIDHAY